MKTNVPADPFKGGIGCFLVILIFVVVIASFGGLGILIGFLTELSK